MESASGANGRPRGGAEIARIVSEAWSDTFQREAPGPDEHFIDLGGDSLTAKRLITGIESALGCRIPFRTILDAPTLGELTARVEEICGER